MSTTYYAADEPQPGHVDTHAAVKEQHPHPRFQRAHRTPGQLELGATEIAEGRSDAQRQVVASAGLANSALRHNWEGHYKSDLLSALVAEAFGVWFYVLAGQAATATLTFTTVAGAPQGDLLMIALAYSFGIMFAINVCAPTSGGHFHPAMTMAQVIFKGFPVRKAPLYIIAQILGAFVASLMVYAAWHTNFQSYAAELIAAGKREAIFTPTGPAGVLAIFPSPGRTLTEQFASEFFADLLIAFVIWSQLDAQNIFASPTVAPYTIGLAFGVAVMGFSQSTVVTNTARDLGARFACGAIYGSDCFPAKFSAMAALTNILSSLVAISIYTFFLSDSRRPLATQGLMEVHAEEEAKRELSAQRHDYILDQKISRTISKGGDPSALMQKRSRLPNRQYTSGQDSVDSK